MMLGVLLVSGAWLFVWAAGIAIVHAWRSGGALDGDAAPGACAWVAGTGFLAGAFGITLWMRLLSLVGIPFGPVALLAPSMLVLVAVRGWPRRRVPPQLASGARHVWRTASGATLPPRWRVAWLLLLLWLLLRYVLLWVSVVEQPLYPWDAWIQWATKARVWFELRRMVPFTDVAHWLAANGSAYTDAAPGYPGTISLWQVYSCTLLGQWDDALMNVPWWFVAVALTLLIYGYLRGAGFERMAALAGASLVATLPLVNVHVALAGYADLPMAAYYTAAALATLRALHTRSRFDIGIAVVLALACPLIKTPGIVWLVTLSVPLVVALVPRVGKRLAFAGFAVALLVLLVLAQTSPTILNYHLHLEFAPPWSALFDSLYMLGSWNLLAYGVVAAALLAWRQLLARDVAPFTLLVTAGVLFLFIVFAFTNARAWVETQTTVNRAILHMAPLLAVWMMVVFRARFGKGTVASAQAPAGTVTHATPDVAGSPALAAQPTGLEVATLAATAAMPEVPAQPATPIIPEVPELAATLAPNPPADIVMTTPTPPPPPAPPSAESPDTAALRLRARGTAPTAATPLWETLLAQVPGDPEALFGLGNAASARGEFATAVEHFSNAVTANPRHFGLLNNLGLAYEKLGRLTDAEAAYRRALVVRPDALPPVANLAQNLFQQKRYAEAAVYFDQLAPHTINDAAFNANRGVCYAEAHRYADAEQALLRAIELAPDRTTPKRDLALVYIRQRRWPDAARLLELVHAADDNDLVALMMLEVARTHIADWSVLADRDRLMAVIQRPDVLDLPPIDPFIFLTWTDDPGLHLAAAKVWMRQNVAKATAAAPQAVPYTPGQPLRMGFVSSDFTNHPVTRLLLGLVERLDPQRFALYAYSTHAHADSPLRTRLATRMAGFREITKMGPVERAAQVRDDGIHILVDLNGYTAGQANDLIAMRPAPLQVNFLGYTSTLGTAACDLIVADSYCIPAAERGYYSEEPLYVDPCYLPSDPVRDHGNLIVQPARSEYGLPSDAVVLSAFSACYKITPEFYDVWMRVLHKVPDAVLWLRGSRPEAEANLRAEAKKRGIDPVRLVFAERDSLPRYMSRWRLADLMLDTFPFGAHTTVNDALFAGVPVLTLAGRSFASRASGSQVIAAGLPELVTTNVADYEALAIDLATNAQRRAELTTRLRTAAATSALFDMDRYAKSFADAMTAAWQRRFSATAPGPAGTG